MLDNAMPQHDRLGKDVSPCLRERAQCWLRDEPGLPLPGHGHTLQRWRALARMGAHDLCLAKVLEAHHDALAILSESGHAVPQDDPLLAVWAAHAPAASLTFDALSMRLQGSKPWCSGADIVDAALVTHRDDEGELLLLAAIDGTVRVEQGAWHALGMAGVRSSSVHFDGTAATRVGAVDGYLQRPGFWHGGGGIAAVWFGAATQLAERVGEHAEGELRERLLGRIAMQLVPAAASLRELASLIDAAPAHSHQQAVLLVRSVVERACTAVLDLSGRALGPGPMCMDDVHARRWADLTVFIRQSHADRDWAGLGASIRQGESPWML